jgi:hypothetical protein
VRRSDGRTSVRFDLPLPAGPARAKARRAGSDLGSGRCRPGRPGPSGNERSGGRSPAGRRGPLAWEKPRRDSIPSAWFEYGGEWVAARADPCGGPTSAIAALGGSFAMSVPPIRGAGPCPQSSGKDPSLSGRRLREAWNLCENRRCPEIDGKKGVKQHGRFELDFM